MKVRTAFVLSLSLACAGCGGKGSDASASGGRGSRQNNPDPYEDQFRIGTAAAPDGLVLKETNQFAAGAPIYVSFVVRNVPAGMAAKVLWKRLDGDRVVGDDEKTLGPGGFVSFAMKDTSGWPPGSYRLVKMIGGGPSTATPTPWRAIGTMDFTISPR